MTRHTRAPAASVFHSDSLGALRMGHVIIPRAEQVGPMALTRVSGCSVVDATAQTAVFLRYAGLSAEARGGRIATNSDGSATLTVDLPDGSEFFRLVRGQAPTKSSTGASTAYETPKADTGLEVNIEGLQAVVAVPGFAEQPVAIAVLDNGTQLVLNRTTDGSTRVAGTFTGSVTRLDVDGDWRLAAARGKRGVFRRTHSWTTWAGDNFLVDSEAAPMAI